MKLLSILTIIVAIVALALFGPRDGQINFNSGTIRYRVMGIPVSYTSMDHYKAEWKSLNRPDEWGTVVEYPLQSTNNTDGMIGRMFWGIAVWSKYDKNVANLLADDACAYIKASRCRQGLPKYSNFYSGITVDIKLGTLNNQGIDMFR